jgi:hypothetical protein
MLEDKTTGATVGEGWEETKKQMVVVTNRKVNRNKKHNNAGRRDCCHRFFPGKSNPAPHLPHHRDCLYVHVKKANLVPLIPLKKRSALEKRRGKKRTGCQGEIAGVYSHQRTGSGVV